jgi:outer membrane receptor protein involved in Fe transport
MRCDSVRSATARVLAVLALVACATVSTALAQGVTSASVRGRVLDEAGSPIESAVIVATNVATGTRYQARSRTGGQFNIENLVLGRYTFEARAIGYRPARIEGQRLALGQLLELDLRLTPSAVELEAITVMEEAANPLISSARTGAASSVSDSVILRLPTLNRNFTDFIANVPQVVGTSVGGLNNRFNNIQIDGAVNNDLFGLSGSGTPGGTAGAVPISVEAVREFQVLIAPFDVRQGGFTGGIVNAVTRSGTNELKGSVFGYVQSNSLIATFTDSTGLQYKPADFSRYQYGFTLSGPIIRDRLHFFTVVDLSRASTPAPLLGTIGSDTTGGADSVGIGIRYNTIMRIDSISQARYGFSPGGVLGATNKAPDTNILFKLTGQLNASTHFELSDNYIKASQDQYSHSPTNSSYGYEPTNSSYSIFNKQNSLRLNLGSTFGGRFTNELIAGYSTVRDFRTIPNNVPLIQINGDRSGTYINIGGERYSTANILNQDIVEFTDNLTFPIGQHLLTLGTHNEFFKFMNVYFPNEQGVWSFANVDAYAAGTPNKYVIALPVLRPDSTAPGPVARFSVKQYGVYLQDKWTVTPRLTLSLGLRYDKPSLPTPAYNQKLDSTFYVLRGGTAASFAPGVSGGIRSSTMSMAGTWSPRLGFNYDLAGNGATTIRGGVGIFTGRPAYVWVSNAFSNTGMEQATLTCSAAGTIPAFTVNPDSQPTQCVGGGAATPPTPSIVFYDPDFKFPQTLRFAFGVDRRLPWGMVGTFDFLFTRYINNYYLNDVNLKGVQAIGVGEGNRVMYGSINATTGSATPARFSSAFADVLQHSNRSGDRAWSATLQIQKRFSNGMEFGVGYSYQRAYDFITLGSSVANSNFRYTTLDGTLANRNLRPSVYDRPHRIVANGSFALPYQINVGLQLTVQSGSPYGYTVSNDANADGLAGNDLIYVPMYSSDISLKNAGDWTKLNNYINSEPCLNSQRGRIMSRNSCRNPWQTFLNARVSKTFSTFGGQSMEISADIFNLPRLFGSILDNNWGIVNSTSGNENLTLLTESGYSAGAQRGIYTLSLPVRRQVSIDASRWKMQFGARYTF